MDLAGLLRPEEGKGRDDLTLLLADAGAWTETIRRMADPWRDAGIVKVAGLDSFGFVFAGAIARELGAGLVLVRKTGHVSRYNGPTREYVDFSGEPKGLTLASGAVSPRDAVLLVDDWAETGAGLRAAASLLGDAGARVVGASVLASEPGVEVGVPLEAAVWLGSSG